MKVSSYRKSLNPTFAKAFASLQTGDEMQHINAGLAPFMGEQLLDILPLESWLRSEKIEHREDRIKTSGSRKCLSPRFLGALERLEKEDEKQRQDSRLAPWCGSNHWTESLWSPEFGQSALIPEWLCCRLAATAK